MIIKNFIIHILKNLEILLKSLENSFEIVQKFRIGKYMIYDNKDFYHSYFEKLEILLKNLENSFEIVQKFRIGKYI